MVASLRVVSVKRLIFPGFGSLEVSVAREIRREIRVRIPGENPQLRSPSIPLVLSAINSAYRSHLALALQIVGIREKRLRSTLRVEVE